MNVKREKAQKQFLDLLTDIDKSGKNTEIWRYKFSTMSDKEFDEFMKNMYKNPYKYHVDVQLNQSNGDSDKIIDMDHIEKVAKKYGIKLREYVAFPHLNPADPSKPVVTATPVPVLVMYIRKMQQMVQKKNFSAGTTDHANPITGQVTGDSKAASLGDSQTFSLTATNQKDAIREFLTIRSDNMEAKIKMLDQIERNGRVSYEDCKVSLDHSQAIQTLKAFMMGAMLKSDVIRQKHKPVDD